MLHLLSRGIAVRDKKILLAHYVEKGYWFLPGGHIEPGESGSAALARECEEEMSLSIVSGPLKTVLEHAYEDRGEMQHEITLLYSFEAEMADIASNVPHLEFRWVSAEEFDGEMKFLPKILRPHIASYLKGDAIPAFVSTLEKGG